ncbi:hypothetical protein CapIbe_021139 [Capra ibex]
MAEGEKIQPARLRSHRAAAEAPVFFSRVHCLQKQGLRAAAFISKASCLEKYHHISLWASLLLRMSHTRRRDP